MAVCAMRCAVLGGDRGGWRTARRCGAATIPGALVGSGEPLGGYPNEGRDQVIGGIVMGSGMPGAGTPAGGGSGVAPHLAAGFAYLFGFVGGIVFLVLERQDRTVRFAAMQSVLLSAAWLAVWVAGSVLLAIVGLVPLLRLVVFALAAPLSLLVGLGFLVAWLLSALLSFRGQAVRLPFLADLAERFLPML